MTYVLIIITQFAASTGGSVTVTTQEFNSLEKCKEAGNVILKQKLWHTEFKTICTKK